MKIRYSKKNEKNIAIQFWKDSFTDNEDQTNFFFDNIFKAENYLVLEENNKIISSLHENDYIFNFNSQKINSKYIVGVSSDLTQRNKGYMSKLLKTSLTNSKEKNIPFVFLTPINPEIYRKFSFEYFSNIDYFKFSIEELSNFKLPSENYSYVELNKKNRKNYLKDLIKIYNYNMNKNFCFLERNEFYFEKLLKEIEVDEMKTFILYKDDVPSAYIIFSLSKDNVEVRECFALDGNSYKEMLALIYGYRDYYHKVTLASPSDSKIEFLFSNQLNIKKISQPFMMMRILDPLFIFKNLNLNVTNLKIYLIDDLIPENNGIYTLGKEVTFSKTSQRQADTNDLNYDLKLNIKNLVPLICGYFNIDELLFLNKIEINKKHKDKKIITELNKIFYKKFSCLYEFI